MKKRIVNEIKKVRKILYERVYISKKNKEDVINRFHKLYYDTMLFGNAWNKTFWLGVETQKCPLDLWVYQEIIVDQKPDIIIETGTWCGGSALYMATICDNINHGEIISIDVTKKESFPKHKRVTYLTGSSVAEEILQQVEEKAKGKKVLIILDSDHTRDHVYKELQAYYKYIQKGGYLIVEDTNLNGHPVDAEFGPGPMEALDDFLKENKDFQIDKEKEKFYMTFNPRGYLKKIN